MSIYVSKESKKEDVKSTAYTFLLVSIAGFILLALFATGVLPFQVADYMKIMISVVMGAMFLIFFIIGIVSFRQLKSLDTQAVKENDTSDEILAWFKESYHSYDIDEQLEDSDLSPENKYFKRYEVMSSLITNQYPDLEESFLDFLIEELYHTIFEENEV